jgi:hypothetical protein
MLKIFYTALLIHVFSTICSSQPIAKDLYRFYFAEDSQEFIVNDWIGARVLPVMVKDHIREKYLLKDTTINGVRIVFASNKREFYEKLNVKFFRSGRLYSVLLFEREKQEDSILFLHCGSLVKISIAKYLFGRIAYRTSGYSTLKY